MSESIEHPALAHLGFGMYAPSPGLASIVQCYWVVHCGPAEERRTMEYLYPSGGMGVVFSFADAPELDGGQMSELALFDGHNAHARRFAPSSTGSTHLLGVRFHPGGAYPVTGIPLHELSLGSNSLQEIGLDSDGGLYERLAEARSLERRIRLLEQWLRHCVSDRTLWHGATRRALRAIQHYRGNIAVATLCEELGVGRRRLERGFRREVGVTPKHYARLLRVDCARGLLKRREPVELAEVGYRSGFYDQAHFSREFTALVGLTPGQYRARREV